MISLESPHRGDSNENTKYTIFNIEKKVPVNYSKSAAIGFSQGLKNEFETVVVNEPSVFDPLKFYCMWIIIPKLSLLLLLIGSSVKRVANPESCYFP